MKSKHGRFIVAFAGLLAALTASRAVGQEKPVELKISHWVPATTDVHKAIEEWAATIEKASKNTIRYRIYPAEQLGKAVDHYDMARDGISDVSFVNPSYQPGRFPIIDIGNLPFVTGNTRRGSAALHQMYNEYASKEMKDVKVCWALLAPAANINSRNKKIVLPEDLKGMRVRPSTTLAASMVTLLGGTNVQAPATQVRDLLEKGVADAVTFLWGSLVQFGIDKVTKYHMEDPFFPISIVLVMNKTRYDSMSDAQRAVVDAHCTPEWSQRTGSLWADFEETGLPKVKADPAHEVYSLTPDQLAAWRKAMEPLIGTWSEAVRKAGNADPDVVLKEFRAALRKNKAEF